MKEKLMALRGLSNKGAARAAALATLAIASAAANAQTTGAVDVSTVTSTISAQLTPIGLIGVAVLGIVVAVKAYHWVKRAIS